MPTIFAEFLVPLKIMWQIGSKIWWIPLPFALWQIFQLMWLISRWIDFGSTYYKPVFYEMKIPADLEKSPKIFEQVITGFHGIQSGPTEQEKWMFGKYQSSISMEIIGSSEGVRFILGTNEKFRNVIEAQVYSHYPTAQLEEVDDPYKGKPADIIPSKINIFGSELILEKEDAYPIRTYEEFQDKVSKEYNDPIVHLIELMDKLEEQEEIWIQVIARPVKKSQVTWHKEGEKLINDIMGRAEKQVGSLASKVFGEGADMMNRLRQAPFQEPDPGSYGDEDAESPLRLLTPGEKEIVEATARNISKLGFQTKIRFAYVGPKERFRKDFYYGVMAAFKQFSSHNLNGFKNNKAVVNSLDYFFTKARGEWRTRRLWNYFRTRYFADSGFVLNTEELATIYHLPDISVTAPSTPRVESKTGEPPNNLPILQ